MGAIADRPFTAREPSSDSLPAVPEPSQRRPAWSGLPLVAANHRLEVGAEAIADAIMRENTPPALERVRSASDARAPESARSATPGGTPLPADTRRFFERRFGTDFAGIRIHTDGAAERAARSMNASAFTHRGDVHMASDALRQGTQSGLHLIAHELAHTLQPEVADGILVARSVDDWLTGSPNIVGLSYTQLLGEIDELLQWQGRQIQSSADTIRIEEALAALRKEAAKREAAGKPPGRGRRRRPRRGRRGSADEEPPLPARRPRILIEMTSVYYHDPAEMRAEYDLIMEWLPRRDLARPERQILEQERDNLAPQLQEDRSRVVARRQAERLQTALTPADQDVGRAVEVAARAIVGIVADPNDPGLFYLYHANERVPISATQAATLRQDIGTQLRHGHRLIAGRVEYYWGRYQAQVEINEDTFLIDDIAGWLGGVRDPGAELRRRRARILRELASLDGHIREGRLVEAAAMLAPIERQSQVIRAVSRAFYEGYIEGAETAVRGLELTRDVSFAIAGSIAAVVAAPVVAGVVAGTGATGIGAGILTTAGTGLVVGTGTGIVRGTSAATGQLVAGGSGAEISEAFIGESVRGFKEGFMSGAAGGAARVLGPALGVGTSLGGQVARRAATGAIVDGTTAMVETLLRGGTAEEAISAGLRSAALSVPGSVVGSSGNRLVRELGGPLAAGATAYAGSIASGATPDDAIRAAGLAVTTNIVMTRTTHTPETDARLESRGREIGQGIRSTAGQVRSTSMQMTGAVMIGTAEPIPALRSGGGSSMSVQPDLPPVSARTQAGSATQPEGETIIPTSTPTQAPQQEPAMQPQAASQQPTFADTEAAFQHLGQELGTELPRPASTPPRRQQVESAFQDAQAAGWVDQQGNPVRVGAVVQEHGAAADVRAATGQTGQTRQSAHIGATSLLRTLQGYSRRLALTVLMPPPQHQAFDRHWMRWISNRRRAIRAFGSSDFRAPLTDVLEAQRQAIRQTPGLSDQQRGTLEMLLQREVHTLASTLPNGMSTLVPLPAVLGS